MKIGYNGSLLEDILFVVFATIIFGLFVIITIGIPVAIIVYLIGWSVDTAIVCWLLPLTILLFLDEKFHIEL